jgi:hypothetical protein
MRARWALSIFLSPLLLLACSEDKYVYRPAEQATATVGGLPAGRYAIPPERPLGTVLVASSGIVELGFPNKVKAKVLAIRMVVANNGDDTWVVDTREQRVIVIGAGESRPAYVNADEHGPPVLHIPRGQKRSIDLYYPLPANVQDPAHLPEFDLAWEVRTGERLVTERTPFDRLRIEPAPPPYDYAWGAPPYWWYDPLWLGPTYVIAPSFHHYPGPPTYVAPVPPPGQRYPVAQPPTNPNPPPAEPARTPPPAPAPAEPPRSVPTPGIATPVHRPK